LRVSGHRDDCFLELVVGTAEVVVNALVLGAGVDAYVFDVDVGVTHHLGYLFLGDVQRSLVIGGALLAAAVENVGLLGLTVSLHRLVISFLRRSPILSVQRIRVLLALGNSPVKGSRLLKVDRRLLQFVSNPIIIHQAVILYAVHVVGVVARAVDHIVVVLRYLVVGDGLVRGVAEVAEHLPFLGFRLNV